MLATLYLLFNEGYKASSGDRLVREELCHEAIRLALQLEAHPATRQPRAHALLALMLFNAARLSARTVAVRRVNGPQAALDALAKIPGRSSLESYHLFHAVRGSFLLELQRHEEALAALRKAESIAALPSEREFIKKLIQATDEVMTTARTST